MLIDDILYYCGQFNDSALNQALSMALRFQVDNVAKYFHEEMGGRGKEHFIINDRIPNIAPLAPVTWFEYGGLSVEKRVDDRFACMLTVDYDRVAGYCATKWGKIPGDDSWNDVRWIIRAEHWAKSGLDIKVSDWLYYIYISGEGEHLGIWPQPNKRMNPSLPDFVPDENFQKKLHAELLVALLATCFSHCKGSKIEEHQPTRQVRRALERAGKPVLTFHTIDILPSTSVLRTEGNIAKNGLSKALHICRGHFAHYTADKPLFGKYTGTFYRPMHIRGSAEEGIVAKDYRVHAE